MLSLQTDGRRVLLICVYFDNMCYLVGGWEYSLHRKECTDRPSSRVRGVSATITYSSDNLRVFQR
jgi:hypothetical protein